MNKITHQGVYQVYKDGLFNDINRYGDIDGIIEDYGGKKNTENEKKNYNKLTGMAWEIFTMFFFIKFNKHGQLGVCDIHDTSSSPFNPGYDFTHKSLFGDRGHIQAKWRSNPIYQFEPGELSSAAEIASAYDVQHTNNILFINFDDREDLFNYKYEYTRKNFRIIGRKTIENYIELHPEFWDEFRECIKKSAQNYFIDPPKLRDVQEWILYGNKKLKFEGTQAVINKTYNRGKIDAATATGKSLCIYHNIIDVLKTDRDIVTLLIPWRALITQTFSDLYKYKMFGYSDSQNNIYDTNISCLMIMSGDKPHFNPLVADIKAGDEYLAPDVIVGEILSNIAKKRKTVMIITKKSYKEKYDIILDKLFEKGVKKDQIFEIVDEYHNLIPSTGLRKDHEEMADYIENFSDRNSGTLFYSASNKSGSVISSDNEEQFGPLLAKVTRNDLMIRGYVCPGLKFKIIRVVPVGNEAEVIRDAAKIGLDINKAQNEAGGILTAFEDLKKYYTEPNLITFGSHVAACHFITRNQQIREQLGDDVKMYVMDSNTKNVDRQEIFDAIRKSGNNILNQHSVAKEGVNIPNLHGGIIDRDMDYKTAQQAIGRSDRALNQDTTNLEKKFISIDNPEGWDKYYNIMYVIVDDEDDTFVDRIKDLIRYLIENGIPKDKWDISIIDDEERVGVNTDLPNVAPSLFRQLSLDDERFRKMMDKIEIEVYDEIERRQAEIRKLILSNSKNSKLWNLLTSKKINTLE